MHARLIHRFLQCLLIAICVTVTMLATDLKAADGLRAMVDALGGGSFQQNQKQVEALAGTGDPKVVPALEALARQRAQAVQSAILANTAVAPERLFITTDRSAALAADGWQIGRNRVILRHAHTGARS